MTVLETLDPHLSWPDPTLCASLFTGRSLDVAIAQVVRPFWMEVNAESGDQGACLWFLRYAKGGEHLKLRLHGPEDQCERWAALLDRHAEDWLRSEDPGDLPAASEVGSLQPLDLEEADLSGAPGEISRARLVRTQYARRDLVMGDRRLLADDAYAALFTQAVARGCELLLGEWEGTEPRDFQRLRQRLFFDRIGAALSMLWPAEQEQQRYIAYHRDWIVRFAVLRSSLGTKKAKGILELYRRERERAGGRIRPSAAGALENGHAASRQERWWSALTRLRSYTEGAAESLRGATDPFAPGAFSPTLFRVLHNLANALGFNPITEGLLFHLLLPTVEESGEDEVLLVPEARMFPSVETAFGFREEIDLFDFNLSYDWWGLIAGASEEGRKWAKIYQRDASPIWPLLKQSMQSLRRRRLEAGEAELEELGRRLEDLENGDRAVYSIIRRFYLGARAYFEYCLQDYEAAERTMSEVTGVLEAAIAANPAVLPIAAQAADVPLKGIKLARASYDWPRLAQTARELLAMVEDEQPLCRFPDGRGVFHSTIGDFIAPTLTDHDRHGEAVRYMLEPRRRLVWFRRQLEATYASSGSFVWYTRTDSSQL